MKNNLIKIILASVLAVGSAKAAMPSYVRDGYNFQNVNDIDGNVTKASGNLAGRITVITTDQRWKADTIYILNNLTFVEAPAVLTIEPGTIIRGEPATTGGNSTLDPADIASLIICRGAKIVAQGTADSPIYFTSWGDPFVPGGVLTIPSTLNGVAKDAAARLADAQRYSAAAYNSSFRAHDVDAQWGGLTILGRAPVGFGGANGATGQLQIAINSVGAGYTQNPTWTFSGGSPAASTYAATSVDYGYSESSFKLEPLLAPVGVASVRVDNGGKFTGNKPSFKATPGDGSRTADKTTLGTVSVAINYGPDLVADPSTTSTFAAGNDYWEITGVVVTYAGIQYNVPTKSGTDPFLKANGFSKAEIALEYKVDTSIASSGVAKLTTGASKEWGYTDGTGAVGTAPTGNVWTAPTDGLNQAVVTTTTSGTTTMTAYPNLRLILSPTTLYGVIVKAPAAKTLTAAPTIVISGGNATTAATATASVSSSSVSDPSAIPLKGGIGANFIEGFQAIDGAAYGLGFAPTVDSDGAAWTTFSGGIYGGYNTTDNSGCIRFCRFSFGGFVLSPNNEINGVTYGGAGSGTVTEFCEVFNNADDDFEFFGGCNNVKYCAGIFGGDDTFDTDMGYRGYHQFTFGLQNNGRSSNGNTDRPVLNVGDNLGENDGNEDPNTFNAAYPGTEFTYFNGTWIGLGYNVNSSAKNSDRSGPNFKDNSGGKIFNAVYVEAPKGAIQDQATTATSDSSSVGARRIIAAPYSPGVAGEPQGVIAFDTWSKCGGTTSVDQTDKSAGGTLFPQTSGRTSSGGSSINQAASVNKTLVSELSNLFVATDVVKSTGTNGRLNGVDPVLATGVDEFTNGTNPRASSAVAAGATAGLQASTTVDRGAFFTANTFRGAFYKFNWLKKWTLSDRLGVYAANSVEVPEVTTSRGATGTVVISFTGATGQKYSIEVSDNNKTFTSNPLAKDVSWTVDGAGATITKDLGRANQITFARSILTF